MIHHSTTLASILLSALAFIALSSCAQVDPRVPALESRLLASPSKEAIVGMWARKKSEGFGSGGVVDSRLFRPDGTGMYRFKTTVLGDVNNYMDTFNWTYDGGGWWTIRYPENGSARGSTARFRTTGKELIEYYQDNRAVLERVE